VHSRRSLALGPRSKQILRHLDGIDDHAKKSSLVLDPLDFEIQTICVSWFTQSDFIGR
jgi:hypothetical protein